MNAIFDSVLAPLEWVVAWLMVGCHTIFTAIGLPAASGLTWGLSIVGLVIVIRIILIPLFVKQTHASRRMQLIQPEMAKIQKKYKGKTDPESRQALSQETMGLYKRTGTNPFASCLPLLLQSPIFFALYRVLANMAGIAGGTKLPIGPLTPEVAAQANASTIFGAPLSATFHDTVTLVHGVAVSAPSAFDVKIVCVESRNCPRMGVDIGRTRSDGGTSDRVRSSPQARWGGGEAIKHHLAPTERGKGLGLVKKSSISP
jgi:YidC/Oxa1 family membrane protein insertase